jgi:hypothetical protein
MVARPDVIGMSRLLAKLVLSAAVGCVAKNDQPERVVN